MEPLSAKDLQISEVSGVSVDPATRVYPRFRAVPMGWSHAVNVCQYVVTSLIQEAIPDKHHFLITDRE
eukprot:6234541-Pyramimonas_sp.AAC.1